MHTSRCKDSLNVLGVFWNNGVTEDTSCPLDYSPKEKTAINLGRLLWWEQMGAIDVECFAAG